MWSGQGSDDHWYHHWGMRAWLGWSCVATLAGVASVVSKEFFLPGLFRLQGTAAAVLGVLTLLVGVYSGFAFLVYVKKHY